MHSPIILFFFLNGIQAGFVFEAGRVFTKLEGKIPTWVTGARNPY